MASIVNKVSCIVVKNYRTNPFALLSNNGRFFPRFFRYQTGLTDMADTVVGGSVGLGLSGGQVSVISIRCF